MSQTPDEGQVTEDDLELMTGGGDENEEAGKYSERDVEGQAGKFSEREV